MKCSLEILDLEWNKLSTISKNYLKGFKKLKFINLSGNNIILLPDLHWVRRSLSTIKAAHNNVTLALEAFQTFDIFEKLSFVNMGGNNIRNFNVTLLRHMPNITNLLLNSNKITLVDDFRRFCYKRITLQDNPWHCGAALSWMGEEEMAFELGLKCATPACLHDMAIADMGKLI